MSQANASNPFRESHTFNAASTLGEKAAQLREFEENERLMQAMSKHDNDLRRKFEETAQIML